MPKDKQEPCTEDEEGASVKFDYLNVQAKEREHIRDSEAQQAGVIGTADDKRKNVGPQANLQESMVRSGMYRTWH